MKTDREQYPFAQCPRFVDEDGLDLSQVGARLHMVLLSCSRAGLLECWPCRVMTLY